MQVVTLEQGKRATFNGKQITEFPYKLHGEDRLWITEAKFEHSKDFGRRKDENVPELVLVSFRVKNCMFNL